MTVVFTYTDIGIWQRLNVTDDAATNVYMLHMSLTENSIRNLKMSYVLSYKVAPIIIIVVKLTEPIFVIDCE